ncbi:MAG: metallophosphoesterase [Bryobacterales bacterium]|nr:metallophosphoesterase [Bryobacterales bacterium]
MRMLVFSDIHGDTDTLRRLMTVEADYYFAAGDLVNFARGFDRVGPILRTKADRVYVLPGNHESEADIERFCGDYGLHPFHGRSMQIDGYHVAGLGCSTPTPFNTPGEYSEAQFREKLEPFSGLKPLVLVCHCPPRRTLLDEAHSGAHYGSESIREFVDQHQPLWLFCGHIHEAAGRVVNLGPTRAANVGKKGYLLDFATL